MRLRNLSVLGMIAALCGCGSSDDAPPSAAGGQGGEVPESGVDGDSDSAADGGEGGKGDSGPWCQGDCSDPSCLGRACDAPCATGATCTAQGKCEGKPLPSGSVCRHPAGNCDSAETCDGLGSDCPPDSFLTAGTECRPAVGSCDIAEVCSGASADCPVDEFLPATTECRAQAGACDLAEACTGESGECPADALLDTDTECRPAAGPCDEAEACTGKSVECPDDDFVTYESECRPAAGPCDVAEKCTGTSASCPDDELKSESDVCRAAAGDCDVAEHCTGSSVDCPNEVFLQGTTCRQKAGPCDTAEVCTGSSASCPQDSFAGTQTTCRAAAGPCDAAETCPGNSAQCPDNAFLPDTSSCRPPAGPCDASEFCSGFSPACPGDEFLDKNAVCRAAAGDCDVAEYCSGDSIDCGPDLVRPDTEVCRPLAGDCDTVELCNGVDKTCPADQFQTGTECRPRLGDCDVAEACTGAGPDCPDDGFADNSTECRAMTGDCDVPEYCTGSGGACPQNVVADQGLTCRSAAGPCDVEEACDGTNDACPTDEFVAQGETCRDASGICDLVDTCTGSSAECTDLVLGSNSVCRQAAGLCDMVETCDGQNHDCPDDAYADAGEECRALAGMCDQAEFCTGTSPDCAPDSFLTGPVCRESTGACDAEEACDGQGAYCPTNAPIGPPPAPALIQQRFVAGTGQVQVSLAWQPSVDPDGHPVEYKVEVDDLPTFASINQTSTWQSATSWDVTLASGARYYWRVSARDSLHPLCASAASAAEWTDIFSSRPPSTPVLVAEPDIEVVGSASVTLAWNPSIDPDGDAVEYYVVIDDMSNLSSPNYVLPWTSATNWTLTLPVGVWYWRVIARDAAHTDATSAWSATDSFMLYEQTSSCPFVFAWNGSGFTYETDIQGQVLALAPGSDMSKSVALYQPSHVLLEDLVPDAQGKLRLKVRETLAEISYFDEAKLLVLDGPAGYRIWSSGAESTYAFGVANPFRIITTRAPRPPVSALDRNGNDILNSVIELDDVPAPADRTVLEYYTFDFGTISDPANAKLLIHGWSIYGVKPPLPTVQPYIEVRDSVGNWVLAKKFGVPPGDLKTMVIDIPNIFVSSSHEIRVHLGMRTGARWVIDQIELDESAPVPVTVSELWANVADLHYRGRAPYSIATMESRIFATDDAIPDVVAAYGWGSFTRYGDVLELMGFGDDMYAVMRHGDELELIFDGAPELKPGTVRTYVLKADVYYKGFRYSNDVEPLPFHGMSAYPYPAEEAYPSDQAHLDYLQQYNSRVFTKP